jgi:AcrR family transcriptional regulator
MLIPMPEEFASLPAEFTPLSGRKAQAARNDELILDAARAVFIADPNAPIASVAERAGVGISALYRRYAGKEALLRKLCADGLRQYNSLAAAALADERDPWEAFAGWMRDIVEADTHSLTLRLAGTFTPTDELYGETSRADELNQRLLARARQANVIRQDLEVGDIALIFEQVAAIRFGNDERTAQLRRRALGLHLDALRHPTPARLPGPAPTPEEIAVRWD